jgi:hypothetical protein
MIPAAFIADMFTTTMGISVLKTPVTTVRAWIRYSGFVLAVVRMDSFFLLLTFCKISYKFEFMLMMEEEYC